jgi:hypothetical protein
MLELAVRQHDDYVTVVADVETLAPPSAVVSEIGAGDADAQSVSHDRVRSLAQ